MGKIPFSRGLNTWVHRRRHVWPTSFKRRKAGALVTASAAAIATIAVASPAQAQGQSYNSTYTIAGRQHECRSTSPTPIPSDSVSFTDIESATGQVDMTGTASNNGNIVTSQGITEEVTSVHATTSSGSSIAENSGPANVDTLVTVHNDGRATFGIHTYRAETRYAPRWSGLAYAEYVWTGPDGRNHYLYGLTFSRNRNIEAPSTYWYQSDQTNFSLVRREIAQFRDDVDRVRNALWTSWNSGAGVGAAATGAIVVGMLALRGAGYSNAAEIAECIGIPLAGVTLGTAVSNYFLNLRLAHNHGKDIVDTPDVYPVSPVTQGG